MMVVDGHWNSEWGLVVKRGVGFGCNEREMKVFVIEQLGCMEIRSEVRFPFPKCWKRKFFGNTKIVMETRFLNIYVGNMMETHISKIKTYFSEIDIRQILFIDFENLITKIGNIKVINIIHIHK